MFLRGGALLKGRIAYLCLTLLGLSAGISFTSAEVSQNLVSKALGKLGGWVATIFNYDGSTSSPSLPSEPLNPIPTMTQAWHKVSEVVTSVIGIVPISYQWIKTSGNSKFLLDFLKNFWNYSFLENLVFNFHSVIKSWMGILTEADTLSKLPDAFTTFQKLAKFLSKEESQKNGDKDMINWLYIRSIVNPGRTIGVLSRHQKSGQGTTKGEEGLKCNGAKKKGKKENNLPLGTCFICKSGNKLIQEMIDFLKKGEIPKDKKKKEK